MNDDTAWRLLCQKFSYRGLSKEERNEEEREDLVEDRERCPAGLPKIPLLAYSKVNLIQAYLGLERPAGTSSDQFES